MPFKAIIDPNELAMLRQVLDEFCAANPLDDRDRVDAAHRVVALFQSGIESSDELLHALRQRYAPHAERSEPDRSCTS